MGKMTKDNKRLAVAVLDGLSLSDAAARYGKSKGRCWQITRAFCLEYFLTYELYTNDGKERKLKELRQFWRDTLSL